MRLLAAAFACVAACAFTAAAGAAVRQGTPVTVLMPGVTYQRQVTFTPAARSSSNVVIGPKPGGLYALNPCSPTTR